MSLKYAAIHNADNLMEQAELPTYSELVAMLVRTKNAIEGFENTSNRVGCNVSRLVLDSSLLLNRIPS